MKQPSSRNHCDCLKIGLHTFFKSVMDVCVAGDWTPLPRKSFPDLFPFLLCQLRNERQYQYSHCADGELRHTENLSLKRLMHMFGFMHMNLTN